tara:strand:+ start:3505 stop:4323 length:819 start_codon:yes stop_codon:yes gene_type:complete
MRNNQRRLGAAKKAEAKAPPAGLVYEVPTEFVELPSRGIFYLPDHPLHNSKTIEVKLMTTKEEDILASTALIKEGVVIDRLLESIIVGDVDPESLLIGDRNAIMIAARISAYGNDYKVKSRCSLCYHTQEHTFDLAKMHYIDSCFDEKKLKELGITWNSNDQIYEYILPKSKVKIGIQVPTGSDEVLQAEVVEGNIITETMKRLVCSVDGQFEEELVNNFVENMLAWDSRSLRGIIPNVFPNVELSEKVKCENCDSVEDREVPLTAEFFWPR